MKQTSKLILIWLACVFTACLFSCTPASMPEPVTPLTAPSNQMRWIPRWDGNDTLTGMIQTPAGVITGHLDTITTWRSGDTTGINYHGTKLYLWWNAVNEFDVFNENSNAFANVCFSTVPFDTVAAFSFKNTNGVYTSSYTNEYGQVVSIKQRVIFNDVHSLIVPIATGWYTSIK